MNNLKKFLFIIVVLSFFRTQPGQAQVNQDSVLYQIETNDGNEFIGNILSRDAEKIVLKTEKFGEMKIQVKDVKKISEVQKGKIISGKFWFDNPQATRYFWAPDGYGLKKKEAYYQNIWILFNQFAYGLTDNFSIGFGMIPLFLFEGSPTPIWITPKISIPVVKDKFNVGAGALIGTVLGEKDAGFGIVYGITTFGSRDKNASFGLGWGYASGQWAKSPAINFSAMIRTGPRSYLITEDYYIGTAEEPGVLISLGGRWIIKRIGLDGFALVPFGMGLDTFVIIPMLGLTIPFGKTVTQGPAK
jgi:hypothetical protein